MAEKHAHWNWDFASNGWADWTCSSCGFTKNVDVHVTLDWDYCPKCGARMDEKEHAYEELPIDLDECECDYCDKPNKWGCYNTNECREDYPIGECCADNLEDNVGKILFKHGVIDSKIAKALVEIIKKERDRNESLFVQREYFKGE